MERLGPFRVRFSLGWSDEGGGSYEKCDCAQANYDDAQLIKVTQNQ